MIPTYDVHIPFDAVTRAFRNVINQQSANRSDFFADLRAEFQRQIQEQIVAAGMPSRSMVKSAQKLTKNATLRPLSPIRKLTGWQDKQLVELDVKFAASYGVDDYSLGAINYLDRSACQLPSLRPFLEISEFSLGNLIFDAPNEECEINVICDEGVRLIGTAIEASSKKRASYFALLGIRFDKDLLCKQFKISEDCIHPKNSLDEIRIGVHSYPVTYICRKCGELMTCKCFDGAYEVREDVLRHLPYGNSEKSLALAVQRMSSREGICSLCTGKVPRHFYGHAMYYSAFLQRYLPYHTLFSRRKYGHDIFEGGAEHKEVENETRRAFGHAEIGQKWLNETFLFKIVATLFAPAEVIQHYRGKELEGLEIDVWIPLLQLGIEYQGEQHYRVMKHWGGQEAFERRIANDQKKKVLCKDLLYTLIEFRHSEEITEDLVRKRLSKFINLNV